MHDEILSGVRLFLSRVKADVKPEVSSSLTPMMMNTRAEAEECCFLYKLDDIQHGSLIVV